MKERGGEEIIEPAREVGPVFGVKAGFVDIGELAHEGQDGHVGQGWRVFKQVFLRELCV